MYTRLQRDRFRCDGDQNCARNNPYNLHKSDCCDNERRWRYATDRPCAICGFLFVELPPHTCATE
jgi:hypothetical protein